MSTGRLIDDLMARPDRAETSIRVRAEQPNSETWFTLTPAAAAQLSGVL